MIFGASFLILDISLLAVTAAAESAAALAALAQLLDDVRAAAFRCGHDGEGSRFDALRLPWIARFCVLRPIVRY